MSYISNLRLVETMEERHKQFLFVHHTGEGQVSIRMTLITIIGLIIGGPLVSP